MTAARPRLTVIDDEQDMLAYLERVFRRDYEVLMYADPTQGRDELLARPADLLIADQEMPGLHGLEVIRAVDSHCPKMARIVLTGHGHGPSMEQATRDGLVDAFVVKPVDSGVLREVAAHARARRRERRP